KDAREQADHLGALLRKLVTDQPDRRRQQAARADRLDAAEDYEQIDVRRQAAEQRPERESKYAEQENLPPAERDTQLAENRHGQDLNQLVDGKRPANPGKRGVELALQLRKGDGDDGCVDRGHERRQGSADKKNIAMSGRGHGGLHTGPYYTSDTELSEDLSIL